MLHILILVPLLTVIALFFLKKQEHVRLASAIGMGVQLLYVLYFVVEYFGLKAAGGTGQILFEKTYKWYPSLNINYHVGVDGISVAMILLTAIVIFAGILASWGIKDLAKEFFISLIILATGAFGFFISLDLFTMFFFYELAVIPMYLLIGHWGSGNKEYSAMKLTLMLMGGSALLLVGILGLYYTSATGDLAPTFNFLEIAQRNIPYEAQRYLFPMIFIGFGIIGAMFPFHTWSPDGHSAAPTAASMLHAGVLMKLGGYGCLKFAIYLMPQAAAEMSWFFILLAITGVVYGAFATLKQTDLKYINAYSSVSHCALVLLGILLMTKASMTGAVLQMFSHGVMTALFFGLIGMIYYRTHTRNIHEMGGLLKSLPFLGTVYIIAGFCSLGLPGMSGFVAEANIFFGGFEKVGVFYKVVTIMAITSIVVTAVYILRVVGVFLLGPIKNESFKTLAAATWNEKLSTGMLVVAIFAVGSAPFWITGLIHEGVLPILDNITRGITAAAEAKTITPIN
ncbi:MAG: complex I subunit 4 family protein [Bacteroidia bacterium]